MPFYIGDICSMVVTVIVLLHTLDAITKIQNENKVKNDK
jgi:hypothetical protein